MGAQPAISDMLRLQTELLQVSVQYELVGKAVSRSTQNIDTLVRMS
jgi:type III secretion protein I